MTESTTVTARVSEELKAELEKYDVNTSAVMRAALEAEARRQRRAELNDRVAEVSKGMEDVTVDAIMQATRVSRDEDGA